MSRTVILALACLALGCGAAPEDRLEQARAHLAAGDYAEAAAAADEGLASGAQGPIAWRLELAALEGEARGGKTDAVLARLERLSETWSAQLSGSLYVQTAGQLKEAGDPTGAIRILDAGARRFSEDADIARAIAQLKATGTDAELDQLRSLGYVE